MQEEGQLAPLVDLFTGICDGFGQGLWSAAENANFAHLFVCSQDWCVGGLMRVDNDSKGGLEFSMASG